MTTLAAEVDQVEAAALGKVTLFCFFLYSFILVLLYFAWLSLGYFRCLWVDQCPQWSTIKTEVLIVQYYIT